MLWLCYIPVWANNMAQCYGYAILQFEPSIWLCYIPVWANNITQCCSYAIMMFEPSIWHSVVALLHSCSSQQFDIMSWLYYSNALLHNYIYYIFSKQYYNCAILLCCLSVIHNSIGWLQILGLLMGGYSCQASSM